MEDRGKGGVAIAACLETVTGGSYSPWRDRHGVTINGGVTKGEHQLMGGITISSASVCYYNVNMG